MGVSDLGFIGFGVIGCDVIVRYLPKLVGKRRKLASQGRRGERKARPDLLTLTITPPTVFAS